LPHEDNPTFPAFHYAVRSLGESDITATNPLSLADQQRRAEMAVTMSLNKQGLASQVPYVSWIRVSIAASAPEPNEWDSPGLKLTEQFKACLVRNKKIDERGIGREAPEPAQRLFAGTERPSHEGPGRLQSSREIKTQGRLGFNN